MSKKYDRAVFQDIKIFINRNTEYVYTSFDIYIIYIYIYIYNKMLTKGFRQSPFNINHIINSDQLLYLQGLDLSCLPI